MSNRNDLQQSLPLEAPPEDDRLFLNQSVWMVDGDGHRVIFCRHEPLFRIPLGDRVHLRMAAVTLRLSKLASQEEIAEAFGHSVATQRRWEERYQKQYLDGLAPKRNKGLPSKVDATQEALVRRWFAAGKSNRQIAQRLAVGEATIRRTLRRLNLKRPPQVEPVLLFAEEPEATAGAPDESTVTVQSAAVPERSEMSESEIAMGANDMAVGISIDCDPADRSGDRALARLGLLEDAVPLFANADELPQAGVLLAVPLLVRHGLAEVFHDVYGSLGPGFYGLRTTVVTLFLCALLRIKRPEQLKEYRPDHLGRIVGLDRTPEVKTIHRKVSRLAAFGRAGELMDVSARRRIENDHKRIAFLYVDGHIREYHGQYQLSKAKKPQRQVVTPATTDTWVHDADGEPLLVVTHEVNSQLTQVLEPILDDVRRLVPQSRRRITVIFDRGGFSPKLFARLIDKGFDVITYRKGKTRDMPRAKFAVQRKKVDGAWREYEVCDRPRVRVGKRPPESEAVSTRQYFWMREVRVLRKDERQTSILTNRTNLTAVEVAYRIFARWRQENFFKYMGEEFALDALVEYGAEDVSAEVDRPNPQWAKITRRLKGVRAEVARLQAELGGQAADNDETTRPTMRGFKIAHAALRRQLQQAEAQLQRLLQNRKAIAKRISASDLQKLKTEKKLIVDSIKMAAYQVETELLGMLQEHYARATDEGRTLLHAAFQSAARLEVTEGELRVTIAAQSSPHRTAALAKLCAQLDAIPTTFPGTKLRLRLAVEPSKPLIS
jgi:transposase